MEEFPTEEEPLDITETRKVRRITVLQVLSSMVVAFNVDRGGIFTIKQLFIHPGKAIRDYIGANRYHYTPPFRILVITTTLAFFAIGSSELVEGFESDISAEMESATNDIQNEMIDVTSEVITLTKKISPYFNFILWTFIPIAAFFSWLINLKNRFNYAEHLVFQTYLFCISNILCFLFPLDNFLNPTVPFTAIYGALLFYYTFGYRGFIAKTWKRSILEAIFIYFMATIVWSILVSVGYALYLSEYIQV